MLSVYKTVWYRNPEDHNLDIIQILTVVDLREVILVIERRKSCVSYSLIQGNG
jgi:hypothetical protein